MEMEPECGEAKREYIVRTSPDGGPLYFPFAHLSGRTARAIHKLPKDGRDESIREEWRLMKRVLDSQGGTSSPFILHGELREHDGRLGITMEYADGGKFKAPEAGAGLCTSLLSKIVIGVTQSLKVIHGSGLVHCDIKPDNIMVHRGYVVLLDMGAAREHPRTREDCDKLSPGQFTPIFASRRACMGRIPTFQDDFESLVYTIAHLKNGGLPWDGVTSEARFGSAQWGRDILKPILTMKKEATAESLMAGLPKQFQALATAVLQGEDIDNSSAVIDYDTIISLFCDTLTGSEPGA
jgi:serine/threonine protein kinase